MPALIDLTALSALLTTVRVATAAYAVIATILTTACLTLHVVTRLDRLALRRGGSRPLFVPLDQAPAPSI
jgi:hypothetical protein